MNRTHFIILAVLCALIGLGLLAWAAYLVYPPACPAFSGMGMLALSRLAFLEARRT